MTKRSIHSAFDVRGSAGEALQAMGSTLPLVSGEEAHGKIAPPGLWIKFLMKKEDGKGQGKDGKRQGKDGMDGKAGKDGKGQGKDGKDKGKDASGMGEPSKA